MTTTSVTALEYLEIGVSDLSAWRTYAENVLGVECRVVDTGLNLRYDDAPWRICLVESSEDDIRCAGFSVSNEADLERVRSQLEMLGCGVSEASTELARARGVDQLFTCEDPFGLTIELYTGARGPIEPCKLNTVPGGFVTQDQGLGHIVLSVADQESAESFYLAGLGFRLSDHILLGPEGRQLQLTFLHCNPRHHTLALAPVAAPKRLNHIMLQVTSLDEVGHGLDRAKAASVPIASSLGKHTNDQMVSFYMQTPSGFDVEYGFGGIEIDDSTWETGTHYATSFWGHERVAS